MKALPFEVWRGKIGRHLFRLVAHDAEDRGRADVTAEVREIDELGKERWVSASQHDEQLVMRHAILAKYGKKGPR